MKREIVLKVMLVFAIISVLFAMSINVYAETDLNDIFEDQGSLDDITEDTTPETTPSTPSTTPEPENTLPDAGIAEDTVMVVTIAGLVILATVAYKKINEYQNI